MKNLAMYRQAVGDRIDVVVMSGTDFGSQKGPFISPASYREVFKPLHKTMNDWVHAHTQWKTFYHTCGSIVAFLDDFARGRHRHPQPRAGLRGGHVPGDPQGRVRGPVRVLGRRGGRPAHAGLRHAGPGEGRGGAQPGNFNRGGGFVFNNVHNIQATVPTKNMLALFEAAGSLAMSTITRGSFKGEAGRSSWKTNSLGRSSCRSGVRKPSPWCTAPSRIETLWQNPAPAFARTGYGDPYGTGEFAGFDEMFPTISRCFYESRRGRGHEVPDHGEVWSIPWESAEGFDHVTFTVNGVRFPYRLQKTVSAGRQAARAVQALFEAAGSLQLARSPADLSRAKRPSSWRTRLSVR